MGVVVFLAFPRDFNLTKRLLMDLKTAIPQNSTFQLLISQTFYNLQVSFLYNSVLHSFSLRTVWLCNFLAKEY